jgi:hypothetical protein
MDFWRIGGTLCNQFPRLFSYVKFEDTTIAELTLSSNLSSFFRLPLSAEAHAEYVQVQHILTEVTITDNLDTRTFTWGNAKYFV